MLIPFCFLKMLTMMRLLLVELPSSLSEKCFRQASDYGKIA
jgi:hypothetical protein